MPDTVKTIIRDILREAGDPTSRAVSKELVLRHVVREAAWVLARFPLVVRHSGSVSSGPTSEVDLGDITSDTIAVDEVWVNGTKLKQLVADDLEGVLE